MKNLHLIFLLCSLLFSGSSYAQKYDPDLIPYRHGDKWGYCDRSKKIIIAPRFKEAFLFEGPVTNVSSFDSGYCVINQKGQVIYTSKEVIVVLEDGKHFIVKEFERAQVFDEKANPVTGKYSSIMNEGYGYDYWHIYIHEQERNTKEGLMDSTFKELLPPIYGHVEFLTKDLIKLYDDTRKKYGVMNLKTKEYYAVEYDDIYPPSENRMMVRKDSLYGFIDMSGMLVIPLKYGRETPLDSRNEKFFADNHKQYNYDGFYQGLAVVITGGKAGFIDKSGNTVIPFEFDKAFGFNGGYAWVQKNGKWGMINKQGKYILQPLYTSYVLTNYEGIFHLEGFHNGLVALALDSLYGYFDMTGKMVIPFHYTTATPFYDGIAAVMHEGKWGFINKKGDFIIRPKFKTVDGAGVADTYPFKNGCAIVQGTDDLWYIIDKKGHPLLDIKFDETSNFWFVDNIADAVSNGKRYFFNNKGKILYTFDTEAPIWRYTPDLFYNQRDKYYFNPQTKVKYLY